MRRVLLSIAVVAAALTFANASHAANGQAGPTAKLTIATVPKLAGVRFALDGRTYVTGRDGAVQIETTHGHHQLQLLDTSLRAPGVRSTFARWGDSEYSPSREVTVGHNMVLDAGFQQSVLVHFAFADGAGRPVVGRVTKLTLTNTLGSRVSFVPTSPQWLHSTGVARRFVGLEPTYVQYSIQQALVQGSNVVNQSQQRFYPQQTRHVTARLLLYSARVSVHDFVFGMGIGSRLDLVYPDGTRTAYPLRGKSLDFSSLPRGTYQIDVHAPGYVPAVSLALSRDQVLSVKVVSYYDMLLFLVLALATVSALILIPRPYLRLRIRSIGSGRRPTPDDLQPPKPLAGERKQLIHRYMTDQELRESGAAPSGTSGVVPRLPAPAKPTVPGANDRRVAGRAQLRLVARLRESVAGLLRERPNPVRTVPRPRLRPAAERAAQVQLTGERLELIHDYMTEQTPSPRSAPPQAAPRPVPRAAPKPAPPLLVPADRVPPPPEIPARDDSPGQDAAAPRQESAPEPETPPETEVPAQKAASPAEAEAPAQKAAAKRTRPAQATAGRRTSTRKKAAAPKPTTPAEEASPKRTTTAKRASTAKTAGPGKPAAAKRTSAKKPATARRTSAAKSTGTKRTTGAKETRPKEGARPKARPAAPAGSRENGTNGHAPEDGAAGNELALLSPDFAAAVKALQDDLREARAMTANEGRRKSGGKART